MPTLSQAVMIKVDVGMSSCISYHHYYPCFIAIYDCHPYFKTILVILWLQAVTFSCIDGLCMKITCGGYDPVCLTLHQQYTVEPVFAFDCCVKPELLCSVFVIVNLPM